MQIPGQLTIYEIESSNPEIQQQLPIEGQLTWPQLTIKPDIDRKTALRVAEDLVFIYDCIARINMHNGPRKKYNDPDYRDDIVEIFGGSADFGGFLVGSAILDERIRNQARKSLIDILNFTGMVKPEMTPEQKSATYDAARYNLFQHVAGPKNHPNLDKSRRLLIREYEKVSGKSMPRPMKITRKSKKQPS